MTTGVRFSILMGGTGKTFTTSAYVVDRVVATAAQPRYAVSYEDVSRREEREYWIAGSSLKIIDLQTNEAFAERLGFMMDLGQGSQAHGRAPWQYAANNACPAFSMGQHAWLAQLGAADKFVEKVVQPRQGQQ